MLEADIIMSGVECHIEMRGDSLYLDDEFLCYGYDDDVVCSFEAYTLNRLGYEFEVKNKT